MGEGFSGGSVGTETRGRAMRARLGEERRGNERLNDAELDRAWLWNQAGLPVGNTTHAGTLGTELDGLGPRVSR